jgi:Animal haem peroxidase
MISRRQFFVRSLGAAAGVASSGGFSTATTTIRGKTDVDATRNNYSRLLPRRAPTEPGSKVEQGLQALGGKMRDSDSDEGRGRIPAGYTYFGQFIDHDLTLDIARLEEASTEGGRINHRTPFLDLEHVYAGGPNISSFLYRKHGADSHDGAESFLLGATGPSTILSEPLSSSCNDLPRNAQGIALVGDARQDENLIIAQLHVAFLRLHNTVIKNSKLLAPYSAAGSDFAKAQRLVTWHYQWLVRNDFLKRILSPEVFDHLGSGKYKPMIKASRAGFRIPVEFSAAAFRFGHSMVRNVYSVYNDHHSDAKLGEELLLRTGLGPVGSVPVPEDWVIKWEKFFEFGGQLSLAQPARKIDTAIAEGLFHLQPPQLRVFDLAPRSVNSFGGDPPELPIRTLLRGARMGLPTGQDVAAVVKILQPTARFLKSSEIAPGPHEDVLTDPDYRFDKATPLWYYILKEAEVAGGNCLGTVGSRIVGEVILAALASDPNSYLNVAGPHWTPTLWEADPSADPLLEVSKFLEISRSDPLTTACSNT